MGTREERAEFTYAICETCFKTGFCGSPCPAPFPTSVQLSLIDFWKVNIGPRGQLLWMGFEPQRECGPSRIEPQLIPPACLIAVTMQFTMMSSA
jgi:hypothetical protein